MRTRVALAAVGVAAGLWGVWLLWDHTTTDRWPNLLTWLAAGVVLHDFVLAPVVLVLGWLASRLPGPVRAPVTVGGAVLGALTVAAIPVLGGWGRRPDNPSLLDRDYPTGWAVVAAVVVVGVVVAAAVRSRQVGTSLDRTATKRGDDGERPGRR